ncbi:MAG: ParA family protein [Actinomycetota bacterium]
MTTVSVLNQKGGVGKTTVVLGLAAAAQRRGDRTLVIDLDPQGSAGWAMGVEADDDHLAIGDVLRTGDPRVAATATVRSGWGDGVDVLPASRNLIDRESDLVTSEDPERLRRALGQLVADYRTVLVDCAPSLGPTTQSGLVASDGVLLVAELSALSLRGADAVVDTIDSIGDALHPGLGLFGTIVNRAPSVSTEAERQLVALEHHLGRGTVWRPFIPQRAALNEAVGRRCPIQDLGRKAGPIVAIFDVLYDRLLGTAADLAPETPE